MHVVGTFAECVVDSSGFNYGKVDFGNFFLRSCVRSVGGLRVDEGTTNFTGCGCGAGMGAFGVIPASGVL